jgi:DNA-binding protein YbaB
MAREIDEAFIEEAIERYQRIEKLQAQFDQAARGVEVTVRSPDGLVEVLVAADGTIKDVMISESFRGRTATDLSRAVKAAVAAAADAASWARAKLHQDMFGEFRPLSTEIRERT